MIGANTVESENGPAGRQPAGPLTGPVPDGPVINFAGGQQPVNSCTHAGGGNQYGANQFGVSNFAASQIDGANRDAVHPGSEPPPINYMQMDRVNNL